MLYNGLYTLLCLFPQIGGINAIVYIWPLAFGCHSRLPEGAPPRKAARHAPAVINPPAAPPAKQPSLGYTAADSFSAFRPFPLKYFMNLPPQAAIPSQKRGGGGAPPVEKGKDRKSVV